MFLAYGHPPQPRSSMSDEEMILVRALNDYAKDNLAGAWENWRLLRRSPHNPIELLMVAECLADRGDEAALVYIDQLATIDRTEAQAIRARLLWRQKRSGEARATMLEAIGALRVDPWPMQSLINRTINLAVDMVEADESRASGLAMFEALRKPFAVHNSDEVRMFALIRVGISLDRGVTGDHVLQSVEATEPNVPWNWGFLKIRSACYAASQHPLAADAQSDLVDYLVAEPGRMKNPISATPGPSRIASAEK
jgi:hypothetical protein